MVDVKLRQAYGTLGQAMKYEQAGQFEHALRYYRDAGEKLVSVMRSHLNEAMRKDVQAKADEAIKRGLFMKKRVEEINQDLKKKAQAATQSLGTEKADFTLTFECGEFYKRLAEKYYADIVRKDGTPKKENLQAVINAHVIEIELKRAVRCLMI
jgi:hypothetical protein